MKYINSNTIAAFGTGDLSGNLNAGAMRIREFIGFSLFIKWTGTPTGNFKLQVSSDSADTPTNWIDLPGSTQAAGGAAGSYVWNITDSFYSWVRVVYTFAAGTGTVTESSFCGKGN